MQIGFGSTFVLLASSCPRLSFRLVFSFFLLLGLPLRLGLRLGGPELRYLLFFAFLFFGDVKGLRRLTFLLSLALGFRLG